MFVSAVALTVAMSGWLAPEAPPAQRTAPPSTSAPGPGQVAPPSTPAPSTPTPTPPAAPPSEAPPSAGPPSAAPPSAAPPSPVAPAEGSTPPVHPPVPGDRVAPPGEAPPPSDAPPLGAEAGADPLASPSSDESVDPAAELFEGSVDPWMTVEDEPVDARPAPPPPPPVPSELPADGQKMLVVGGIIGGLGLLSRVLTTGFGIRAARDPEPPGPMAVEQVGAVFFTPLIATGMGLVAGAMARRGRVDAHRELFEGQAPRWKRRLRLGWGLFGAGMGVWAITRLTPLACRGESTCAFRHYEVGYYISLAGTIPGIVMGSYASGYNEYRRRNKHLAKRASVSAAPLVSRDLRGLSVSARF